VIAVAKLQKVTTASVYAAEKITEKIGDKHMENVDPEFENYDPSQDERGMCRFCRCCHLTDADFEAAHPAAKDPLFNVIADSGHLHDADQIAEIIQAIRKANACIRARHYGIVDRWPTYERYCVSCGEVVGKLEKPTGRN
jgi:hypothetical protein